MKKVIFFMVFAAIGFFVAFRLVSGTNGCTGEAKKVGQQSSQHRAIVTAYTSRTGETDKDPCIASDRSNICQRFANGERICATGDRNVPFGTRLQVPGYGTCTVADRMNARYDGTGRVDIYFGSDTPTARTWGKKELTISRM